MRDCSVTGCGLTMLSWGPLALALVTGDWGARS